MRRKPFLPTFLILVILLAATALRAYNFEVWPPGLSNDEANNANDALRFARTLTMPLYQLDARPEPLFRFIQALTIATIGPSRFGFRVASLFLGVLSVAAAYRAGRHLSIKGQYGRWFGLVAAATLAVMVSHIHLSRVGYRAMPQVLGMLLFFDAFIVGWRVRSRKRSLINFALAGLWLSVTLLSYTAGLIMLAVAALGVGQQVVVRLVQRIRGTPLTLPLRGIGLFLIAFAISSTPLIILNSVQPQFYGRAAEVAGTSSSQRTPIEAVERIIDRTENAWIMFNDVGDINPQYNVDRAPLLPLPVLYNVMLLGLLTCIIMLWRLPFVLAIAMLLLSLQPVALSNEIPHGLRIMGAFAAVPLVVAAGLQPLVWVIDQMPATINRYAQASFAVVIAAFMIFAGVTSFNTFSAYYQSDVRWGDNDVLPAFSWFFELRRYALSEVIAASEVPVYVPLKAVDHSAGRYFTADTHPDIQTFATYFDVTEGEIDLPAGTILVPPDMLDASTYAVYLPEGTLVLLPRLPAERQADITAALIESGEEVRDPYGELAAIQVNWDEPLTVQAAPQYNTNINYNNQLTLVGWDAPLDIPSGEPVDVTLYFRRTANKQRDVFAFVQLWDWNNERIASSSEGNLLRWLYPPDQWAEGDVVPYVLRFTTPDELPFGAYGIAVGLRNHLEEPVPVLGADGSPVADAAIAGRIRSAPLDGVQALAVQPTAVFGEEIALLAAVTVDEAQLITVTLEWQALAQPKADYVAFVHIVEQNSDTIIVQSDVQIGSTRYPSGVWRLGEVVSSEHQLALPETWDSPLTMYVGLYSFPSLERLPLPNSDDNRVQVPFER